MRTLIGLCGYSRSGKDEAASALVAAGWERRAFADALKAIAREVGWDGAKTDTGRVLLQRLGAACRVHLGPDVWIGPVLDALPARCVITDVRYPNEWAAIKARGGIMVRVVRPGVGPVNGHRSETAVDDLEPDVTIVNDGTVGDLHANALDLAAL